MNNQRMARATRSKGCCSAARAPIDQLPGENMIG